jgi:hypothetical protein
MKADVNINDCARRATMEITVSGLRSFRFRMFVVMSLLRLVAWIAPFDVEIIEE